MAKRAAFVLLLLVALIAVNATPVLAAAPSQEGEIEVQIWPGAEPGQTIVITSVQLPESADLPATVRIPIPSGMKVDWAGEIAGQTAEEDVQREPRLVQGQGGQYAEFEITEFRLAQIETSGAPLTAKGGTFTTEIDYVQSAPSPTTGFSVRIPSGVQDVRIEPTPAGDPSSNSAGERLYTLPSREMTPGQTQRVSISYSTGAADGGGGVALSRTNLIAILLGLMAVSIVALLFALSRQRSA